MSENISPLHSLSSPKSIKINSIYKGIIKVMMMMKRTCSIHSKSILLEKNSKINQMPLNKKSTVSKKDKNQIFYLLDL